MSRLARWAYGSTVAAVTTLGFWGNRAKIEKMANSPEFSNIKDKYMPDALKDIDVSEGIDRLKNVDVSKSIDALKCCRVSWNNDEPNSHFPFKISFEKAEENQDNSDQTPKGPSL